MAFTFDATVGGETANSYVTVADADDYFTGRLDNALWSTTAPRKQAALAMATVRLNLEQYGGQTTTSVQALQWPRNYIVDYEGHNVYIPNDVIPPELTYATCELALHYMKQEAGEFSVDEFDLETLTSYKVGPLDFGIKNGYKADRLPTKVQNMLIAIGANAYVTPSTQNLYMVR